MKLKLVSMMLIFTVILAGCTSSEVPASGESWRLVSLTIDGAPIDLGSAKPISLEIGDDTQVSGSSGCNTYFGNLEFKKDGSLVAGTYGGTEMACVSGMEVEAAYLGALSQVESYTYTASELKLMGSGGKIEMIFQQAGGTY